MPRLLARDRLTWLTYAHIAIWGYFLYGFSPVVPLLRDEQHTSRTVASLHGTAFAVGGVLSGLLLPSLIRRFGRARVIWGGLAGVALSAVGLLASHPLAATLTWAVVASTGGGLIVNGVTAVLADHHRDGGAAAISEANAGASAVGLIAPLVVGSGVAAGLGWRPGLAIVAGAAGLVAVLAVVLRVRVPTGPPLETAGGRLPTPFWLVWVSILATGSVEVCLNLWVADALRTHAQVSPAGATAAVSAIIGGMFVGRLVGSRFVLRLPTISVMFAALSLSGVGFAVFWVATVPWLALFGLVVVGLGNALHYPLSMALAVSHSAGQPDLAVARTSYAVGVSFGVAPFLLAAVADRVGPHLAFLLVPVFLVLSAVAIAVLRHRVAAASLVSPLARSR
ncbi:MFS transporter [Planosporangium flavigriseum]|uniref:MFS transporter n=1 Tax=Planosporangium flavigriseum TaxID=373681 RepID=UPI0014393D68|nr:MFS transporter [Planosporangium flavigriseum]NJC63472.1 MFS transporter [Planosporangium flavigriseum]